MSRSTRFMTLEAFLNSLSPARFCHAIQDGWLWLVPFLLLGLGVAWLLCHFLPKTYRATATFTLDPGSEGVGVSYGDYFNSRLGQWYSQTVLGATLDGYRARNPQGAVADEELVACLLKTRIELKRNSHLATVEVPAPTAELAVSLANGLVSAIEAEAAKATQLRMERLREELSRHVEKQRKQTEKAATDRASARAIDPSTPLRVDREVAALKTARLAAELSRLEAQEVKLAEFASKAEKAEGKPEQYAQLAEPTVLGAGISVALRAAEKAEAACRAALVTCTKNHPMVRETGRQLLLRRKQLAAAVKRAKDASKTELRELRQSIAELRARLGAAEEDLHEIDAQLGAAETGLQRYDSNLAVENKILAETVARESGVKDRPDYVCERIIPGMPAHKPEEPSFPNPLIFYSAATGVALLLGLSVLLLKEFFEDRLRGLDDIRDHLGLDVLAVLPHVAGTTRGDVVGVSGEGASQPFAEAVSGLRNLLYPPQGGRCRSFLFVSTQPGEGKSVTAAAFAASLAQSEKKTLLIDFDLRRPQQAGIWGQTLAATQSLSHVLQGAGRTTPDFSKLVRENVLPNLNILATLPPDGIHPASIFGLAAVPALFAWARVVYDCVVVDAPPYGGVGDTVKLSTLVDAVVLVCRPDRTHAGTLVHCARELDEAGARVAGVVVNDANLGAGSPFAPTSKGKANREFGYAPLDEKGTDPADEDFSDES